MSGHRDLLGLWTWWQAGLASMDTFFSLVEKLSLSLLNQALSRLLVRSGCPLGLCLSLAIGFALKAFLATEGTLENNMMAPSGGEGGSGAGSSQRPIDLNLPPSGRDELFAALNALSEVEREIEQIEQKGIQGLNSSRIEALYKSISEIEKRIDFARSLDEARAGRDRERSFLLSLRMSLILRRRPDLLL